MQVLKFGGTSVGKPERMRRVAELISDSNRKIVVLSAVSGTTNKLVALSQALYQNKSAEATERITAFRAEYTTFIHELYVGEAERLKGQAIVEESFGIMESYINSNFTAADEKVLLAQGELISTQLFQVYLASKGVNSMLLPALAFMRIDKEHEPDLNQIQRLLLPILEANPTVDYFITQGYICKNANGEIDNLQRGGSDYTATLIGAAVKAAEIQIWTDIDGVHNNDPRAVKNTFPIPALSYREAAELAYFGAKILHPTCVLPAERMQVPLRLKNTFVPEASGTLISSVSSGRDITAIAAKDKIVAINIHSARMLMAYGFLKKVFEVFEKYKTPIDMITTSEVSVSLTIDTSIHLDAIMQELSAFSEASYQTNQSIVCIVGDNLYQQSGTMKRIFSALEAIPIRMASYGGSNNNVSLLINSRDKVQALNLLNEHLFENQTQNVAI